MDKIFKKYGTYIVIGIVALALYYYFFVVVPGKQAVATPSQTPAQLYPGAVDAADSAAAYQMDATIKSQFPNDYAYIIGTYATIFAPGKPQAPSDDYGTINGKAYATSGLLKAVWTGWIGSYTSNAQVYPPPAVSGKTQAQANAAYTLGQATATIWNNFKAQEELAAV